MNPSSDERPVIESVDDVQSGYREIRPAVERLADDDDPEVAALATALLRKREQN